jgi:uncharacterized repeat protein (TIGR03803 family)
LIQGSDGNLYGTTAYNNGGNPGSGTEGSGTVFQISTNGALISLYFFPGSTEGANPEAGLVQGSDGNFYGTTDDGGPDNYGTVFKITTNGALSTLYSFTGGVDGANPEAGLVQGRDGNFYGATIEGGAGIGLSGFGTVFQISTNGTYTSLYSFTGGNDGANPEAGLVQGSDGNFYGTTASGGTNFDGTVFKITTNGALTSLYSFGSVLVLEWDPYGYSYQIALDGAGPNGLVQGSDGSFYGTTEYGGTNDNGTVFKISTNGALTTLYSFGMRTNANGQQIPPPDGANPEAGLVQGSDGNFYGTTATTVFQMTPAGVLTTLNSDVGSSSALVQGSDGCFYGTTQYGGTVTNQYGAGNGGYGTVFRISTNGALTYLHLFTGGNDGANPYAGLVQGRDGSFYGTTDSVFGVGVGTVFRLTIVPEFQQVTLSNNTLSLTWSTEAGGTYQLQYTSELSSGNWSNLGSAITATGATLNTTDSLTNGPQRFYRLALLP